MTQPSLLSYKEVPKLVEQVQAVGKWLWCLLVFLNLGGSSLCRVNQFSVVHEYGGEDAWKSWRMKNDESKENRERRKEMKGEVKPQSTKYFHFVSIWQPMGGY